MLTDPSSADFIAADVVFRDYDIRGIAGQEISPEFALRLGKTLGTLFLRNGQTAAYVGRDGRLSSPQLAASLSTGLLATGCDVIDLGEITTPVLNFAVHHGDPPRCGVMVTASHNPAHYNGFKMIMQGRVIAGETLQQLKPVLNANHFPSNRAGQHSSREMIASYREHIVKDIKLHHCVRVVVDGGHAVAGPIAIDLFERLGCQVFPLHCDVDGSFPAHEPNPAEEKNLQSLIAKVKAVKADLGLAFDGDGDRVVAISSRGEIIWPDRLMMIFASEILRHHAGANIVFDVKSSRRLAELVRRLSGQPIMCKTGHAHVRQAVHDNHAPLGGEFSGHIFFNDRWQGFDDGLYAAARLMEVLCAQNHNPPTDSGQALEQILAGLADSRYTSEILIPVDEQQKFVVMQTLADNCQFTGAQIINLDGLRVEYPQGWGLIRASNTSAYLTLRFEAEDDTHLAQIKQIFSHELSPFIKQIEEYL